MGEREPKTNPEEEMGRAVGILRSMQNCSRFEQDRQGIKKGRIRLLYNGEGSEPRTEYIKTEDFLKAVDYYYKNRDAEFIVNFAMQKLDGVVNVFAPFKKDEEKRPVVLEIKNYMVPQILEFAYLILRQSQKTTQK